MAKLTKQWAPVYCEKCQMFDAIIWENKQGLKVKCITCGNTWLIKKGVK